MQLVKDRGYNFAANTFGAGGGSGGGAGGCGGGGGGSGRHRDRGGWILVPDPDLKQSC